METEIAASHAVPADREEGGRRAQIVRAAAAVLGRQGYSGTSLKEIAREAGVAQGLLHYYFESKEELLLAVVTSLDLELRLTWKTAVAGVDDPLERIVAAVDAAGAQCSRRPEFWRLLFDLYMLGMGNPAIHGRIQELWSGFVDDIEAEVRQVLDRLPAQSLVTPHELAGAIAASIDGLSLAALVEDRDPAAHFHAFKLLLLSLVVTSYVTAGEEPPVARLRELLGAGDGA